MRKLPVPIVVNVLVRPMRRTEAPAIFEKGGARPPSVIRIVSLDLQEGVYGWRNGHGVRKIPGRLDGRRGDDVLLPDPPSGAEEREREAQQPQPQHSSQRGIVPRHLLRALRQSPLALHGAGRAAQHMRRLIDSQAGKIPELHDALLIRIDLAQPMESLVDRQHVCKRGWRGHGIGSPE